MFYIPVISMLIDIFICTEEANGTVFFDIDCNTECWNSDRIEYAILATFALILVIPTGMYLRMKFQELPPDLNILTNPRFIFIKTTIIICMIVVSKVLIHHSTFIVPCLSVGILSIISLTIIT